LRRNTNGFGSYYDWRPPTPEELHSIVNYSTGTRVDASLFPFVDQKYWSNMTVTSDSSKAWGLDFSLSNLTLVADKIAQDWHIMAVRRDYTEQVYLLLPMQNGTVIAIDRCRRGPAIPGTLDPGGHTCGRRPQ